MPAREPFSPKSAEYLKYVAKVYPELSQIATATPLPIASAVAMADTAVASAVHPPSYQSPASFLPPRSQHQFTAAGSGAHQSFQNTATPRPTDSNTYRPPTSLVQHGQPASQHSSLTYNETPKTLQQPSVQNYIKTNDSESTTIPSNLEKPTSSANENPNASFDYKYNDEAFEVVASLLIDCLSVESRKSSGIDHLLPFRMRRKFVDAVKYRMGMLIQRSVVNEGSIEKLTKRCYEMGFGSEDETINPLLRKHGDEGDLKKEMKATSEVKRTPGAHAVSYTNMAPKQGNENDYQPQNSRQPAFTQRPVPVQASTHEPKYHESYYQPYNYAHHPTDTRFPPPNLTSTPELAHDNSYHQTPALATHPVFPQPYPSNQAQSHELSDTHSSVIENRRPYYYNQYLPPNINPSIEKAPSIASGSIDPRLAETDIIVGESYARRQIMSELREATQIWSDAKTSEAKRFWSKHIESLQARLAELTRDGMKKQYGIAKAEKIDINWGPSMLQSAIAEVTQQRGDVNTPRAMAGQDAYSYLQKEDTKTQMKDRHDKLRDFYGINNGPPQSTPNKQEKETDEKDKSRLTKEIETETVLSPLSTSYSQNSSQKSSHKEGKKGKGKFVDVEAPCDLPEGYIFEAKIDGYKFSARVPTGGVKRGQIFSTPVGNVDRVEITVPIGQWRDGIFQCFSYGLCHPLFLNALFAPHIALGQIMSRVGLNWLGQSSRRFEAKHTCVTLSVIVVYWFAMNVLIFYSAYSRVIVGKNISVINWVSFGVLNFIFWLYTVCVLTRTRSHIRSTYMIPDTTCGAMEDVCCSTFCPLPVITQMGRHTADFDTFRSLCCTETGLPEHIFLNPSPLTHVPSKNTMSKHQILY